MWNDGKLPSDSCLRLNFSLEICLKFEACLKCVWSLSKGLLQPLALTLLDAYSKLLQTLLWPVSLPSSQPMLPGMCRSYSLYYSARARFLWPHICRAFFHSRFHTEQTGNDRGTGQAILRSFWLDSVSRTEAEDLFGKARLRCMRVRKNRFINLIHSYLGHRACKEWLQCLHFGGWTVRCELPHHGSCAEPPSERAPSLIWHVHTNQTRIRRNTVYMIHWTYISKTDCNARRSLKSMGSIWLMLWGTWRIASLFSG